MASRGLYGTDSASDESDKEQSSVGDVQEARPARRWLTDSDSSGSEERGVVRSADERKWVAINLIAAAITNALRSKDWSRLFDEVNKLDSALSKARVLVTKDGLSTAVLEVLRDLSTETAAVSRADQRAMKRAVSVSFVKTRSKVTELVAAHKAALDAFKEKKDTPDDDLVSLASSHKSESSDTEEEEELTGRWRWVKAEYRERYLAELARKDGGHSTSSEDEDEDDETVSEEEDEDATEDADEAEENVPEAVVPKPVPGVLVPTLPEVRVPLAPEDLSPEIAQKKLLEYESLKGEERLRALRKLLQDSASFGPEYSLVILAQINATRFVGRSKVDDKLTRPNWLQCVSDIHATLDLLDAHPALRLEFEDASNFVRVKASAAGLMGKAVDAAASAVVRVVSGPRGTGVVPVVSQPFLIAGSLSEDFLKSLRSLEVDSTEYRTRLMDEEILVRLLRRLFDYYRQDTIANTDAASRLALLWLRHGYYKHETMAESLFKSNLVRERREAQGFVSGSQPASGYHPAALGRAAVPLANQTVAVSHPAAWEAQPAFDDQAEVVRSLASYVLKHGTVADKPSAALMHIYHAAIHNRYSEAKELMLASRLHDDMRERDEACQILFNRCMAQIAMAFFRAGLIQDAHAILANIFQRRAVVRELLAQGSSQKYGKVDFEREKAEKRRRVPAHMFINVDQLEACHLVCSMLLEVPVLAACQYDSRPRARLSQQYYKLMEERDRMIIIGPPEATDDCVRVGVMQASQHLNEGDWKQCLAVLLSFNVWNLWPAGYGAALSTMLADKVKEAALEVFLYTRGPHYSSLSREYLSTLFELSDARIRSFVSTFVINKEFAGCWDDATGTLIIHDTVPTKVQGITADLVDKLGSVLDIVERNERNREPRGDDMGSGERAREGTSSSKTRSSFVPSGSRARQQQQSSGMAQSQSSKKGAHGSYERGNKAGAAAGSRTWA